MVHGRYKILGLIKKINRFNNGVCSGSKNKNSFFVFPDKNGGCLCVRKVQVVSYKGRVIIYCEFSIPTIVPAPLSHYSSHFILIIFWSSFIILLSLERGFITVSVYLAEVLRLFNVSGTSLSTLILLTYNVPST